MNLLNKPSVTAAVRSLEKALVELEAAQTHHTEQADAHLAVAAEATSKANAEALNAARAERIRNKLASLLA